MLDHERLDVYKCSIQFLSIALAIVETLPRGHSALADQLRRAAISIPLNIAEGTGKISKGDRRKFYAIARGSAMECGAIIDVVQLVESRDKDRLSDAKQLIVRIVSMLTQMTR